MSLQSSPCLHCGGWAYFLQCSGSFKSLHSPPYLQLMGTWVQSMRCFGSRISLQLSPFMHGGGWVYCLQCSGLFISLHSPLYLHGVGFLSHEASQAFCCDFDDGGGGDDDVVDDDWKILGGDCDDLGVGVQDFSPGLSSSFLLRYVEFCDLLGLMVVTLLSSSSLSSPQELNIGFG